MKSRKLRIALLASLMLSIGMYSCDDSDNPNPTPGEANGTPKYLLALDLTAIDSYPFHVIDEVDSGRADIDQSQEIPDQPYNVPVTTRPGEIFLNSAEKLTKYSVGEDGILKDEGSLPNLGISGGPVYEFLDNERLMISSGPRQAADGVFGYQIINTATMTEESNGSITLPVNENSLAIPSSYILRDAKIFVPYLHTDENYIAYDEATVAIYDASTLEFEKLVTDSRTASVGYSIVSSHGITENGDLYLISCNSNYWAGNESLPSGILRIKAGEDDFDDEYFFNITEKINNNHTGGMLYVGNNKAIVQIFRSDLISDYGDYQGGFVIEYYLVDLVNQTTQKLNIPLSKYPRRALERLDDGRAVIVANTESEGNAIYIYDPATESVSKGITYEGAEFISAFMSFE